MNKKVSIIYVLLAALFYALNAPFSKMLMDHGVSEQMLGGLLYIGAGLIMSVYHPIAKKKETENDKYKGKDFIYLALIVVCDVVAIICMLLGIKYSSANTASLLSNFEVVATSSIAFIFFKEKISPKLWVAIGFISLSTFILSLSIGEKITFNIGSLLVIIATSCWGLENCIAKKVANKSTSFLVLVKGFGTGISSLAIGFILGETLPAIGLCLLSVLLGMVVFGLSTFCYFRGLRGLGASKTSVYYASSPFISSFLCFIILGEKLTYYYLIGLGFMILGTLLVIIDTLDLDIKKIFRRKVNK